MQKVGLDLLHEDRSDRAWASRSEPFYRVKARYIRQHREQEELMTLCRQQTDKQFTSGEASRSLGDSE